MKEYDILYEIQFSHGYFLDSKPSNFVMEADALTQSLFGKSGLVFKFQGDHAYIASEITSDDQNKIVSEKVPNEFKLSFFIYNLDADFTTYTADAALRNDEIFYWNNLAKNSDSAMKFLHQDSYSSFRDILKLKPKTFSYAFSDSLLNAQIKIVDESGTTLLQNVYEGEHVQYNVDLQTYPNGVYSLFVNDQEFRFYAGDFSTQKKPLGILEIFQNSKLLPEWQAFDSQKKLLTQNYNLCFQTKETYWRYIFLKKDIEKFENLKILTETGEVQFHEPVDVQLSDGKDAVLFQSLEKIPLQQRYNHFFQLRKNYFSLDQMGIAVLDKLPSPYTNTISSIFSSSNKIPDTLNPTESSRDVYFSELYIYF